MGLLIAATQNNSPDITDRSVRSVARASQVYTAAGVTSADLGGAVLAMAPEYGTVGFALNQIQVALQRGVLEPRVDRPPSRVYGLWPSRNRQNQPEWLSAGRVTSILIPATHPPRAPTSTSLGLKGVSAQMGGKAPEGLPANRFFMGAWKIMLRRFRPGVYGVLQNPRVL